MSIIRTDILIKTALEMGLADLRKNSWILDDIFGGLLKGDIAEDPFYDVEYGYKEVAAAKKWFLNNDIPVELPFRVDTPVFPCITVVQASSQELTNQALLADLGITHNFDTTRISPTMHRIYSSVTPVKYDINTGIVTLPKTHPTDILSAGQYLVSTVSGKAYEIKKIINKKQIQIDKEINDDFRNSYIVPAIAVWNMHYEYSFFQDTLHIGCHTQSDPAQCRWLSSIVQYILLRYKEAYIDSRGFQLTTFSLSEIAQNTNFNPEIVFSQMVTLSGIVIGTWFKFMAPRFDKVTGQVTIADGSTTPISYQGQINTIENIYMANDDQPPSSQTSRIIGKPSPDDEE